MEIVLEVLLDLFGSFVDSFVTALPYIYSTPFGDRTQRRRIAATEPRIVIVAGAFQTGWHYSFLKEELTKAGYEATIVVVPSTGGWKPVPDSLAKDVEATREVVTKKQGDAGNDLVVVAHSQGGVGASTAFKGRGKKGQVIKHRLRVKTKHIPANLATSSSTPGVTLILYLQSFLLAPGISTNDLLGNPTAPWLDVTSFPGIQIPHDALDVFYHDVLDRGSAEKAAGLVVPDSRSVREGDYGLGDLGRGGRARLIQSSGFKGKVLRVKSGLSPFLSMPKSVAGITRFVAGEKGVDLEAPGIRLGDGGDGSVKEGWKEDR